MPRSLQRGKVFLDPDPQNPDPTPGPSKTYGDDEKIDWLTGSDLEKIAGQMTQRWVDQGKLPEVKTREAKWRVNELRREGWTGVRLIRESGGMARAWAPMGSGGNLELSNEARRLCRVFVGNMLADPPAPQVFPADTGEDDRDTSDVSERALGDLQSERRLNTPTKVRDALDTACTYGSGYIVYTIDQTAGGRVVRTMQASPLAQTTKDPLIDPTTGQQFAPMEPVPVDPMAQKMALSTGVAPQPQMRPKVDPMSGQPLPPPSPVERLVSADGTAFTEDAQQAAYDWTRDLKSEVLSGKNVRLIPHTVENIWDASGVMVATWVPLKSLKSMFPVEIGNLPQSELETLIRYRPPGGTDLLPLNRSVGRTTLDDNALVFTLVICYHECGEYPDGFYGIAVGGKQVPWRKPWVSYATGKREALLLPASQIKLWRNGRQDPAGDGLMDDLGAISEVMAAQIGHLLAYLDWFNNPTVYVPLHSTIQDSDILARKPIIRILPGGEPKMLQPPVYPKESMTVFELMRDGAKEASHMMDTAQGLESPNVQSGRHAYQIVAQVHAQLSEPKQNIERGYIRCCEIELQYARAFGLEGDAKWTGDDGSYKIKRWQGADLGGDVVMKPGTMTMLSPAAKAQLVEQWMDSKILSPEEGRDMLAQGIGAVIGLRDDPFKLEIRRQISQWEEGPPPEWQPFDPLQAAAGMPPEQLQAIALGQAPPPEDPMMETLWEPRPHHTLPGVAQIRLTELAKLMATRRYHAVDRGWQALVEQEFQRMMMVVAPPMPPMMLPGAPGVPPGPPNPGGGGFGSPNAGMPSLDNPALTGGQPGGGDASAPMAPSPSPMRS